MASPTKKGKHLYKHNDLVDKFLLSKVADNIRHDKLASMTRELGLPKPECGTTKMDSLRPEQHTENVSCVQFIFNYQPQRSCHQGNVLTPICHSVHRGVCLSACWDTTPWDQVPPRTRHPPGPGTPQDQAPLPRTRHPPEADSNIWSMSDRYASYWNAFLFQLSIYFSQIDIL